MQTQLRFPGNRPDRRVNLAGPCLNDPANFGAVAIRPGGFGEQGPRSAAVAHSRFSIRYAYLNHSGYGSTRDPLGYRAMNELEVKAGLPPTPAYRYAKQLGKQLYVAGQVPQNGSGIIVGINDAGEQSKRCLENLELLLSCYHYEMTDVQLLVVYVVGGRGNLTAAWASVQQYFSNEVPPVTLIGVALLGYESQLVEIDATVVREEERA